MYALSSNLSFFICHFKLSHDRYRLPEGLQSCCYSRSGRVTSCPSALLEKGSLSLDHSLPGLRLQAGPWSGLVSEFEER